MSHEDMLKGGIPVDTAWAVMSSNERFTKGEWKCTVSRHGRHQVSGANGRQVAILWNCPQRQGNGALISKAKDMYLLLKAFVEEHAERDQTFGHILPPAYQMAEVVEMMEIIDQIEKEV